jgi:hypothetical protein
MKKLNNLLYLMLVVSLITACNKANEDPATTLPVADGTATINFLNYPSAEITAAPADFISIAVEIVKGQNRTQKLRIYQTDVLNTRGTQLGSTIDLRNVDDPQVKNINYSVPATFSGPKYLYFEVDESGGKFSRRVFTIQPVVTGTAPINEWTNIQLGAQSNDSLGSRMSSQSGYVYKACDVEKNINDIDITFALSLQNPNFYLSSNPARFLPPIGLTVRSSNCPEGPIQTDAGRPTYFSTATDADYNSATEQSLGALSVSSTNNQYIGFTTSGSYYSFLNAEGKKGVIFVRQINDSGPTASVTLDIKVQR